MPTPRATTLTCRRATPSSLPLHTLSPRRTKAVSREALFSNYLYRSATSTTLQEHFRWLAAKLAAEVAHGKRQVLELACNDGSMLDALVARREAWQTFGVDPAANLAQLARDKGHTVHTGFWGALRVHTVNTSSMKSSFEPLPAAFPRTFDAIVAQNVLAHVPSPVTFLRACAEVMRAHTRLYVQTSQCNMMSEGQFDTVYHEHISFFSAHSFAHAAKLSGLQIVAFETVPIHGISCLLTLMLDENEPAQGAESSTDGMKPHVHAAAPSPMGEHLRQRVSHSMRARLEQETREGVLTDLFYDGFRARALATCDWLGLQLRGLSSSGFRIGAYGAAAKGMTVSSKPLEPPTNRSQTPSHTSPLVPRSHIHKRMGLRCANAAASFHARSRRRDEHRVRCGRRAAQAGHILTGHLHPGPPIDVVAATAQRQRGNERFGRRVRDDGAPHPRVELLGRDPR